MRLAVFGLMSLLVVAGAETALAQWQVGPVYPPQNVYEANPYSYYATPNYNPFRFNHFTGRFDYVPLPYEEPYARVYSPPPYPSLYNPYTGQWMYGATPPPPMQPYVRPGVQQEEAVHAGYTMPGYGPAERNVPSEYEYNVPTYRRWSRLPSTQPATRPATQP